MRMPDTKLEIQTLSNKEFKVKDVRRSSLRNVGRICLQRNLVVRCLGGKKQCGQPKKNSSDIITVYTPSKVHTLHS